MDRIALLSILVAGWSCPALSADDGGGTAVDPAWVARARTEIPQAVERYRTIARSMDEATVVAYRGEPAADGGLSTFRNRTIRCSVQRLGNNLIYRKATAHDDDPGGARTAVEVHNEDYSFTLNQHRPDSAFVLVAYALKEPHDEVPEGGSFVNHAYQELKGIVLRAVNGTDGHRLAALRWDESRGLLFARVERDRDTRDYWIDPSPHWHIAERTIRLPSRSVRTAITYGAVIDGEPCPVRIVETGLVIDSRPVRAEMTLDVRRTTTTAGDYRLSAFGLPEPVDAPKRTGGRTYLGFLTAAVLCIIVAVLLRLLAQRSRCGPAVLTREQ